MDKDNNAGIGFRRVVTHVILGALLFAMLTLAGIFLLNDMGLGFLVCLPSGVVMRFITLAVDIKDDQFNRCVVIGAPIVNALLGAALFGSISLLHHINKKGEPEN